MRRNSAVQDPAPGASDAATRRESGWLMLESFHTAGPIMQALVATLGTDLLTAWRA
jgi:hypothetical protein